VPADVQVGTDSPMTEADMPEIKQNTRLVLEHYAEHNISNILFFFCEGVPQLMLRTHRSLKAFCATPVMKMKMSSFLPSFTSNGAPVE
jgi:hypothetical protein